MRYIRKILKVTEYGLVALLLGVTVFSVVEYVQGIQPFYVVSDNPSSMSPTLNYGDVALVYKPSFDSLNAGDIVIFNDPRGNQQTIIHRIVEVEKPQNGTEYLITKGDNNVTNPTVDPWNVTSSSYLSKNLVVIPFVGYLSPALWGLSGIAIVFPIVFLVLAITFVSYLWQKKSKPARLEVPT